MIPGSSNPLMMAAAPATGAVQIERSLRFNSSDSAYCLRTPSSNGTSFTTWTWSMWVKRSLASSGQVLFSSGANTNDYLIVNFDPNDTLRFLTGENGATNNNFVNTAAVFRDYSAWYHFVIQADFTNAISADRIKIYANNVRQTLSGTIAAQNYLGTTFNRSGIAHNIGRQGNGVAYLSGYLADIYFIDGQALDATAFTEVSATTGQLIPKAYSGSFGTNGFWMKFTDNSSLTSGSNVGVGKDYSGNANYFNTFGLSVTAGAGNDSLVDTPTSYGTDTGAGGEVRGNYATLNALEKGDATLSNGNLDFSDTADNIVRATIGMSSGKWYWEATGLVLTNPQRVQLGIAGILSALNSYVGSTASSYGYISQGALKYNNAISSAYGTSGYIAGDIIGIAFDADTGTLSYYKNGVSLGTAFSGIAAGTYFPAVSGADGGSVAFNFGQRPFAYQTPGTNRPAATFKALCDTNLGPPLVALPNQHFNAITYTGNGSTLTIPNATSTPTSIAFDPGFIWFKQRSSPKRDHNVYDVIRGTTKLLSTNGTSGDASTYDVYPGTGAEQTVLGLTAFNTGSKTVDVGSSNVANGNSASYVAWAWYGGATTASNTQGSITSQVRANVSAGFSVVTFTGAGGSQTVGHGLGVTPSLIIAKNRATTNSWAVWFTGFTANEYLVLNGTSAKSTFSTQWGSTPTSTVFGVADTSVNGSGNGIVAYCFAPVVGYSSFGSYTGNGLADGPFVYTGFRPKWLMIKVTNISGESWVMKDAVRNTYNPVEANFYADLPAAEQTSNSTRYIDFTSNGFKLRGTEVSVNGSANTYVYMCFAESPFQSSRAR